MQKNTFVKLLLVAACITIYVTATVGYSREPAVHVIEIKQLRFSANEFTVKPGDMVTWINHDFVSHRVVAIDDSWNTGAFNQGESRSITVTQEFQLRYFCEFHPSMQARL